MLYQAITIGIYHMNRGFFARDGGFTPSGIFVILQFVPNCYLLLLGSKNFQFTMSEICKHFGAFDTTAHL